MGDEADLALDQAYDDWGTCRTPPKLSKEKKPVAHKPVSRIVHKIYALKHGHLEIHEDHKYSEYSSAEEAAKDVEDWVEVLIIPTVVWEVG